MSPRLSVFAGGCTMAAAEAVIADDDHPLDQVLDLLSGLVDKSLVTVDRTRSVTRYDMLETVRQYADERLVESGEAETIRRRHTLWSADLARAAGRGLYSSEEEAWLERLRAEIDNLEVAVGWAVDAGETEVAMRIGASFPRQVQRDHSSVPHSLRKRLCWSPARIGIRFVLGYSLRLGSPRACVATRRQRQTHSRRRSTRCTPGRNSLPRRSSTPSISIFGFGVPSHAVLEQPDTGTSVIQTSRPPTTLSAKGWR